METKPYDRRHGETAKAYEAFSLYRNMGLERSIDAVAKLLGKSTTFLCRWSSKHEWVERVEAWDIDQDMLRQEEAIAARREQYKNQLEEFQKNHLAVGKAAFKASATATKQIMEWVEKNNSIDSWDDANKAANIIKALMPIADLWAKSLAVDKLLDRLEGENG